MFRKLTGILAFALMDLSLLAPSASAAVSYFPESGGTVGKGDVQQVLGFNNGALQEAVRLNQISFVYVVEDTYSQVCTKTIEPNNPNSAKETQVISHTYKREVNVSATVQWDPKAKNQVAGFILAPIGQSGVEVPTNLCPNERSDFIAVDVGGVVTFPQFNGSAGGLFVVYKEIRYLIPNTPPI